VKEVLQIAVAQFIGRTAWPAPRTQDESPQCCGRPVSAVVLENPPRGTVQELSKKGYTRFHWFAVLPSCKAPRWLLPLGDTPKTLEGFQIYTPYAPAARLLKAMSLRVIRAGWNGWGCHRLLVASGERLPLEKLVAEVTGERAPVFALSLGTPWRYRKVTVQAMRPSGTILGYIKLPLSEAAIGRLHHEATILDRLSQWPELRPYIPRVLHAGPWGNGYLLFTAPVVGEPGPCTFSQVHEAFLEKLWCAEHLEKPGRTVVEEVAARWSEAGPQLSRRWDDIGKRALERARHELGNRTIPCGISHGDFAPWNTRLADGQLSVFDWESATWETPNLFDIFSFHVRVGSLLRKPGASTRLQAMNSEEKTCFLLYILNFVSQSLTEGGQEEEKEAEARRFRLGLEYFHRLLTAELSR